MIAILEALLVVLEWLPSLINNTEKVWWKKVLNIIILMLLTFTVFVALFRPEIILNS